MKHGASLSFLKLLCNLRWLAVLGQASAVTLALGPVGIALPAPPLWSGIGALAVFNLYATWRIRRAGNVSDFEVFIHILVDIAELSWLIAFSGGGGNPFASLLLIPIALSVLALPPRLMGLAAIAACAGYLLSTFFGSELPPVPGIDGGNFALHKVGMMANFIVSAAVVLVFFTRTAAAGRRSEREVAELREKFARNEGILALATHAASVAHELNTPLGTLTLMVDELADEAGPIARREDIVALKSLLEVCRQRVRQLAAPADSGAGNGLPAPVDLNLVIEHWQLVRPMIELHRSGSIAGFELADPTVGHLLRALLNNAADASEQSGATCIDLHLQADEQGLHGEIRDYGVGFDQVQPPLPAALYRTSKSGGLGIGLALSHATVERLGGTLSMQATEGRGIRVQFSLPRTAGAA